jgi:hypothetical protein
MLCPELFAKRRGVHDPRQIGRFDPMIDHRSRDSETRRLNCIRTGAFGFGVRVGKSFYISSKLSNSLLYIAFR